MNNVTDLTVPVSSHTHLVCITQLSRPRLETKNSPPESSTQIIRPCLSHLFSTFPCYVLYVLREEKEFFSVCNDCDMLTQQHFIIGRPP